MQVGFVTLRDIVTFRPPLRDAALEVLLQLTTHPRTYRQISIVETGRSHNSCDPQRKSLVEPRSSLSSAGYQTSNPWALRCGTTLSSCYGGYEGLFLSTKRCKRRMGRRTRSKKHLPSLHLTSRTRSPSPRRSRRSCSISSFCLRCLRKCQSSSTSQYPQSLRTSDLSDILLCRLFQAYPDFDPSVQEAIQELITALMRSLGPNHPKLQALLRTYPEGAESLALRILHIFTVNQRPPPSVVSLVKYLMAERGADARFLMLIIAEMDKVRRPSAVAQGGALSDPNLRPI